MINLQWNVVSNFDIEYIKQDNTIEFLIKDDSLIGESFLLELIADKKVVQKIQVNIVEGF